MAFIKEIWRRIQFWTARERASEELEEEMQVHRRMKAEDRGAMRAAQDFGNLARWKEISRAAWGYAWLESFWQDARFGFRVLRKSPGLTITAGFSLALGIGAATALFSLLNSLLFKALPVPEPQQLMVFMRGSGQNLDNVFTYPSFARLRELSPSVDLFASSNAFAELNLHGSRREVNLALVSGGLFPALHIVPLMGRLLTPEDDRAGSLSARSAVISYRIWKSAFHGDPAIVGQKILLDSSPFVIAGVTGESFFGLGVGEYKDISVTIAGYRLMHPENTMIGCNACYWLNVMSRLKPNVSTKQAQAALAAAWRNVLHDSMPESLSDRYKADYYADHLVLEPGCAGLSSLRSRFTKPLYLLLAMTGLILLISCFNIANLLITRSLARQRELAVRLSIGANRGRLIRQLLTEGILLALAGLFGAAGIYQVCRRGLLRFLSSGGEKVYLDSRVDIRLAAFAAALTLTTVAVFALVPAWRATRQRLSGSLAESSQTLTANSRVGQIILAGQLGLSLTLVMASVLLSRSLYELRTFDAGFRRDHLVIVSPEFGNAMPKKEDQRRFMNDFFLKVRELSGVRSASESYIVPMGGSSAQQGYTVDEKDPRDGAGSTTYQNVVSSEFFGTVGTQLLAGRDFNRWDGMKSPKVAVVNDSFAKHFWGAANPLGKRFRRVEGKEWITVVGVVRDAKYRDLRAPAPRTVYLDLVQTDMSGWTLQIEAWTSTPPSGIASAIRELVQRNSGGVSLKVELFNDMLDRKLLYERLISALAICFGCLGLLISGIGVYGVAAYSVTRRTMEVGLRMALGATPAGILKLVFVQQSGAICAGICAGVAGALALGRFLQAWLFGVGFKDPWSLMASIAVLSLITAVATFLPATRAARIEPLRALRYE